jgi:hypothetical protein
MKAHVTAETPVTDPDLALRNFENALRQVMTVSKHDLNNLLEKKRAARLGRPKRGPKPKKTLASVPAVSGKD